MSKKATGLTNLHYSKITVDAEGVYTFATPKRIPDAEEVTVTNTYAEGSNYADNRQNIYVKKATGADISLALSAIKREIEADMLGKTYTKGGTVTTINDIQPQIAILFQKTFDDGSYENIVYYNTKFTRTDDSGKTSTDNIEFNGVTLEGKATPLPTGELMYVLASDEITSEDTEEKKKLDNFFKTVQFIDKEDATV